MNKGLRQGLWPLNITSSKYKGSLGLLKTNGGPSRTNEVVRRVATQGKNTIEQMVLGMWRSKELHRQ